MLSEIKEDIQQSYNTQQFVVFLSVILSSVLIVYRENVTDMFLANYMQSDNMKAKEKIKIKGHLSPNSVLWK